MSLHIAYGRNAGRVLLSGTSCFRRAGVYFVQSAGGAAVLVLDVCFVGIHMGGTTGEYAAQLMVTDAVVVVQGIHHAASFHKLIGGLKKIVRSFIGG